MIPSPEIQKAVRKQNEARGMWMEHETLERTHLSLLNEGIELADAVGECEIGQSAFAVASEIGDVYYLYIKYKDLARIAGKEIAPEIAQLMEYAEDVCNRTGINAEDAIKMKLFRNSFKYNDYATNNGYTYEEGTVLCKDFWDKMGGDSSFSKAYEIYGEEL